MVRSYPRELVLAAVDEHDRGVRTPITCQRYGISERTLYRWVRSVTRARAESPRPRTSPGGEGAADALHRDVLALVLQCMSADERAHALRLVQSRLHLTHDAAMTLLTPLDPESETHHVLRSIGMPLMHRRVDAPLAEHFGKARWLLVHATPDRSRFIRNVGLNGVSTAAALRAAGCTDAVALGCGGRARERLVSQGVRLWRGLPGVTAHEHISLLRDHRLGAWPGELVTLRGGPERS